MSEENKIREIQLKAQYKALSEVEEMWGVKPSKHRAYLFVVKRMTEILKELKSIESWKKNL